MDDDTPVQNYDFSEDEIVKRALSRRRIGSNHFDESEVPAGSQAAEDLLRRLDSKHFKRKPKKAA